MNDIFKDMQAKVGCEYISDLPSYKRKVWQEMKRLNPADYEERQLLDECILLLSQMKGVLIVISDTQNAQSPTKEKKTYTVEEIAEQLDISKKVGSIENYINPIIGDWKLNEITTKSLSKYYNDLLSVPEVPRANRKATGRCVQPANIKKIHDIIRCALNQAIRWEYIDTNKRMHLKILFLYAVILC